MYIPRGIHSTTEVHVLRPQTHVFPPAYILSESAAHGRSYSYLHTLSFERRASAPHAYILYGALLCADHAPGKKTEPRADSVAHIAWEAYPPHTSTMATLDTNKDAADERDEVTRQPPPYAAPCLAPIRTTH